MRRLFGAKNRMELDKDDASFATFAFGCFLIPFAEAEEVLTKDNMTPKIYGGFDFGVNRSVVMEGKTDELSFTDQSLRAVRLMATTQEESR